MKKILALLLLVSTITFSATAQSTSTRAAAYGVTDGSFISAGTTTLADVASATLDTLNILPSKYITTVNLTVADSVTLQLKSTAGMYRGDLLDLYIVTPAQTGTLKLLGNYIVNTGTKTISLTASKKGLIRYWFDGANLVEYSRNLNY